MAAEAQCLYGNSHHQVMATPVTAKGFAKEGRGIVSWALTPRGVCCQFQSRLGCA